jgi:hypothetical protein
VVEERGALHADGVGDVLEAGGGVAAPCEQALGRGQDGRPGALGLGDLRSRGGHDGFSHDFD